MTQNPRAAPATAGTLSFAPAQPRCRMPTLVNLAIGHSSNVTPQSHFVGIGRTTPAQLPFLGGRGGTSSPRRGAEARLRADFWIANALNSTLNRSE